jgi:2-hydroxy-3-oxopropionate reductase
MVGQRKATVVERRHRMKIGFIGLGIMGRPMALNLKNAGHELTVPERKSLTAEMRAAAQVVADAKSVAANAEVLILMVPDTPDVESVLFGPDGAAEGLKRGTLVIDMSSISPLATKEYARKVNGLGCDYLDAPVSGGEVGAKQATLTIMVGGPEAALTRAKPLFETMGKNITHVGNENGTGQTCKVANQIIVALNIQAVSEALVFASKAGADPAKVRAALMGGFASSRILEVHAERMLKGTFDPGFRIRLHQKDLNLALAAARELGLALPNTATAQQMFSSCAAHGGADLDHSAMVLAIEGLADHAMRSNK